MKCTNLQKNVYISSDLGQICVVHRYNGRHSQYKKRYIWHRPFIIPHLFLKTMLNSQLGIDDLIGETKN
jgi:hypothetical protein